MWIWEIPSSLSQTLTMYRFFCNLQICVCLHVNMAKLRRLNNAWAFQYCRRPVDRTFYGPAVKSHQAVYPPCSWVTSAESITGWLQHKTMRTCIRPSQTAISVAALIFSSVSFLEGGTYRPSTITLGAYIGLAVRGLCTMRSDRTDGTRLLITYRQLMSTNVQSTPLN